MRDYSTKLDEQFSLPVSEEEQVRKLFNEYFNRLSYFAFRILKDQDKACDMAQDAFYKYWVARSEVENHPIAIKNFLYSTVKNSCLNVLRHEKVVSDYASNFDDQSQVESSIMDSIITAEVLYSLDQAIRQLPEKYRLISELAYLEGKKNQEIADLLGMSINTVKKQKQKALELLRLRLTPELLSFLLILPAL